MVLFNFQPVFNKVVPFIHFYISLAFPLDCLPISVIFGLSKIMAKSAIAGLIMSYDVGADKIFVILQSELRVFF